MKRRTFLTAGTLPFFAGCGSIVSQTETTTSENNVKAADSGPSHFEQVELSGPSKVHVNEEFELEVSVANTGGRAGDFTTTLTVGEGIESREASIKIEDVDSGERKTEQVAEGHIGYASTFTYRITDYAVKHEIEVTPQQVEGLTSAGLTDNLTVSLDELQIEFGLIYSQYGNSNSILFHGDLDRVFVIVTATVENTGTKSASVPTLEPLSGEHVTQLPEYVTDLTHIRDLPETPIHNHKISPKESKTGALLYHLPRSVASETIEFVWQRDRSETTPEVDWQVPPQTGDERTLPRFALEDISTPDNAQVSEKIPVEATVANIGDTDATFRGAFEYSYKDSDEFKNLLVVSGEIPKGDSKTFERTMWENSEAQLAIRLAPFAATDEVTFTE